MTGGSGFIGSRMLQRLPYEVLNFDLSKWMDLRDRQQTARYIGEFRPDVILHFAAKSIVSESVRCPDETYETNVIGTLNLLDAMKKHGVQTLIFSSSASVYGNATHCPIREEEPLVPVSPYGKSKAIIESILSDYAKYVRSISLRYFNVTGPHEHHNPETHLVPLVIKALMQGDEIPVYGDDFDTPDRTCIRDYVHIDDVIDANLLAIDNRHKFECESFNIGTGKGTSVSEVVNTISALLEKEPRFKFMHPRSGDVAQLVCDPLKANIELGWIPKRDPFSWISQ